MLAVNVCQTNINLREYVDSMPYKFRKFIDIFFIYSYSQLMLNNMRMRFNLLLFRSYLNNAKLSLLLSKDFELKTDFFQLYIQYININASSLLLIFL